MTQTQQTTTHTAKTVAQIEAWIVDLERIKKQEGGAGDFRMYQAACLSLRTAERLLAEARRAETTQATA